jgi:hypothetical protein
VPVALRIDGLRVVIFVDDHEPAHVHVFGDGECKITLGDDPDSIRVTYAIGVSAGERRRAVRAVRASHAFLTERWATLHG